MSDPGPILLQVLFLLLTGFFALAETVYLRPLKFQFDFTAKETNWADRLTDKLLEHPLRVAAICLTGQAIGLLGLSAILASQLYPELVLHSVLSRFAIFGLTVLSGATVIFAFKWFIPRLLVGIFHQKLLTPFALPLTIFYYLFYPIVHFITGFNRFVTNRIAQANYFKDKPAFASVNLEEHLKLKNNSAAAQEDAEIDTRILENAIEFRNVKLRECMVPRTELEAIEYSESIESLRKTFIETGHSKILIYKETIDNIIGYCHQLSLFRYPKTIAEILTPVTAVPENMLANELLVKFIADHRSMALVVDEFGGTSGIVTIEDIIEEIFGEIQDEYDEDDLVEQALPEPDTYLFSARHEIDYLNEKYGFDLPYGDYETLGGFILSVNEDIPQPGDVIEVPPFTITVLTMDENRINTVHFTLHPEQTEN